LRSSLTPQIDVERVKRGEKPAKLAGFEARPLAVATA